jgi:hypothetical protein
LPVVDSVASDYLGDVSFLAVAGRSDMARTAEAADELFSGNLAWGLDDRVWDLYGVPGQPATILISNGVIVDQWFGAAPEEFLRERLDRLVSLSG